MSIIPPVPSLQFKQLILFLIQGSSNHDKEDGLSASNGEIIIKGDCFSKL